jgi:hypothetical protein
MSETEKALSTQTKEILGETVVLGEGFYDDDDPIEEEKGSWSSYVTEKLVGAKEKIEKFKGYVEDFKTKLVGEPELETMYVPELKVTPLQKNPVFPTEDVKTEEVETPIVPKEKPAPPPLDIQIYNYLINEKKLSQNKALGIMANIKGESDFSPGADEAGDGSEGIGLFQYTFTTRKNKFLDAVPDYKNNWRGQIDFFLTEPEARRYIDMEFKSANDAATYLLNNNLRPEESLREARKEEHKTYIEKFLDGLQ